MAELASQDRGAESPGRPASASESVLAFLLYVLRVFTTRIWVFIAVALLVLALMAYSTLRSTPIYRATGIILIERQTSNLKNLDDPLQINTSDADYYNTQVKIIQGLGLADRVVARWFCGTCSKTWSDRVLKGGRACPQCSRDLRAVTSVLGEDAPERITGGLDVSLARNNRIVEISYEHSDRLFAAAVVNAVIEEYQEDMSERRVNSIRHLHGEMMEQLKELEARLQESEREIIDFYKTRGLHLGDEQASTLQRLMHEAGLSLLREEQELARVEALAEQIRQANGDVSKLRSITLANGFLNTNDTLEQSYAVAKEEMAAASQRFGVKSQAYAEAAARVTELEQTLREKTRQATDGILAQAQMRRDGVLRARKALDEIHQRRLEQDGWIAEAEIKRRTRDANRALYDALNLRAKESSISSGFEKANVQLLRAAVIPRKAVRPNHLLNMLIGLLVALISGAAAIVLLDRIDNTVRTTADIEDVHDLSVLSVVPQVKPETLSGPAALACWKDEHTQLAEAFRRVRAAILLSVRGAQGGPIRQIMVVSPGPDEGKTITAVNLAISLAQMGERTLLLDADFYRSESHRFFGLDREKGLSTILVSDISLSQVIQPTAVPFLDYMATGLTPPQPASLLGSARMAWVIQEATRMYSRIVIDTAPLVAVTDATLLAPHADATLLVVRDGKTSKTALHRSLQTLARIGVQPIGFVFNGVRTGVGEFYFRYHHPSYEMESEPPRERRETEARLP